MENNKSLQYGHNSNNDNQLNHSQHQIQGLQNRILSNNSGDGGLNNSMEGRPRSSCGLQRLPGIKYTINIIHSYTFKISNMCVFYLF